MKRASTRTAAATAVVCAILLGVFAAFAWQAGLRESATADEPLHLVSAWLTVHDHDFRCDPEDPPLWKYYAVAGTSSEKLKLDLQSHEGLAMLSDPYAECDFACQSLYLPINDADSVLNPAQARMLFLGVLLGGMIAWWAWRLGGAVAAIAACTCFCLDPNFMAHAVLMKNDVAITLAMLWFTFAIWRLGRKISVFWFVAVCTALGITLTTKYSGVLMVPILVMLLGIRALLPTTWPMLRWNLTTRAKRLAAAGGITLAALLVSWGMIWACYCFRFGPTTNPAVSFDMKPQLIMAAVGETMLEQRLPSPPTNEVKLEITHSHPQSLYVKSLLMLEQHHLLPQTWLVGLMFTYSNSLYRPSYLWGWSSNYGWWYYFPLAMLFKTPMATLAAIGAAVVIAAVSWVKRKRTPAGERDREFSWVWPAVCLAIPPAFYLACAMRGHIDLGLRHVLTVYPYIFIGVGIAVAAAWRRRPLLTGIVGCLLGVVLLVENLTAFPDYIPFFNAAAGGERNGIHLLSDCNLDWGQDLPKLAEWQRANPTTPLWLCYFGAASPRYYGLHYVKLPGAASDADLTSDLPSWQPDKGVVAISATDLLGTYFDPQNRALYAIFRSEEPIKVIGGSIYLFKRPVGWRLKGAESPSPIQP